MMNYPLTKLPISLITQAQHINMTGISPSQFKRLKGHKLKPLYEV